ncbi:ATP synthase epsilon chain [Companilactobacillus sp. RD055328]|uniref:F0F1 ATP synthase subunit epsilon n=1 Tax=Companilactobacillus sp. RD055328 TaxID=2916634 RepID=UPI001FC80090|nr:F0F1 ATP synthase subunit epsilon [Companilactobacillus sp. RD055328]GKQ42880.1 ATP synthase epsilon chain [Companilactobacillus sp. RD055328]
MADDKNVITVNIVTPAGLVYDHKASIIIAEAVDGSLGIMANHEPIIAPLKISELRVKRVDNPNHENAIAVNGGFLEFSNNVVSIVADSAERARDIDLRRAEYARQKAEENIEKAVETKDKDTEQRARVALARAVNRINVSNHK